MRFQATILSLALAALLGGCLVTVPAAPGTVVMPGSQPVAPASVSNPVITSFTANPITLKVGQPLTVQIEAVSPSGKTLQFVWSGTAGTLSATSGRLIVWSAPTVPGTYSVLVSVTDGVGGQAAASLNVTVTASGEVSVSPPVLPTPAPVATGTAPVAPLEAAWSQIFGVKEIEDFHFINSSFGWVIQSGELGDGNGAKASASEASTQNGTTTRIRHTTDAGRTWQTQFEMTKPGYEQAPLSVIYFADTQNGWAAGYNGTLLRTTDEGKSWTLTDWDGAGRDWILSLQFKDLAEGLMSAGGGLHRSTDGGANWTKVAELAGGGKVVAYFPNGKAFINQEYGPRNLPQAYLYEGGTLTPVGGIEGTIKSITFPDPSNTAVAWATVEGARYTLYRTDDGGVTFTPVTKLNLGTEFNSSFSADCVAFSSAIEGLVTGHESSFVTRDGGKTWESKPGRISTNATLRPMKLQLFDLSNAYCGLEYGYGMDSLYRFSR